MRIIPMAVVVVTLAVPAARSAEPVTFNPGALVSHQTGTKHMEHFIAVFPPAGNSFEIPLPLIPQWFAYGPGGRTVYETAIIETGSGSFSAMQPDILKTELDPVRVSKIQGMTAFYSTDRFAISQSEDLIVFSGAKGYPAGPCGVYEIGLPAGDIRAVIETSDCRAGSPWSVLSLSPEKTEALISANRSLGLLDLARGSITKIEGQLSHASFSPDGKWIAAGQYAEGSSKTVLIDRKDLTSRRDLGRASNNEIAWSPDSKFLLQTVYRPACPSQDPLALETVEVQTGNHTLIKDSVCNCGSSGQVGWIRSDIKR
jgi:WD40-like Beta Propeller Repeat